MASRLEITRSPSISTPGRLAGRPPVASSTRPSARRRTGSPSSGTTSTSRLGVSLPRPRTTSTRFFFINAETPPASSSTTPRLRAITRSQSWPMSPVVRPNSSARAQQPQHLGLAQQGLGGDAAPVEAGASETFLGLHQRDAQAELGGADGGGGAAGAAADDYEIDRVAHDVDGKRGNVLI